MSNLPAVDLIIRVRNIMIVFQIHTTAEHKDVLEMLKSKAGQAGWNKGLVPNIILVYLSPNEVTAQKMEEKIGSRSFSPIDDDQIITRFFSIRKLFLSRIYNGSTSFSIITRVF